MLFKVLIKIAFVNLTPNGKSGRSYGISALYARDKKPFMDDLQPLFQALEDGRIKPIITTKIPILEAAKADELLEKGQVIGNIVLGAPSLMEAGERK